MSLPFTTLLGPDKTMLPVKEMKEIFQQNNIDLNKPIWCTCGSGVTAAVLFFAFQECGASNVALYDGSWSEYAIQPDAVIIKNK